MEVIFGWVVDMNFMGLINGFEEKKFKNLKYVYVLIVNMCEVI